MRIQYCNKYDYPFSGTEAYLFDLIGQRLPLLRELLLVSRFRRSQLSHSAY